jgi:hypothetical protein
MASPAVGECWLASRRHFPRRRLGPCPPTRGPGTARQPLDSLSHTGFGQPARPSQVILVLPSKASSRMLVSKSIDSVTPIIPSDRIDLMLISMS